MHEPRAPSGEQFELAHADQRVVVVEVGGGLRTYSAGARDILDGYALNAPSTSGRGQVLAPWPNRLQDGCYEFDGRRHQLPLTQPEHHNAIHGLVRWASWTVAEREQHRVVMQHVIHHQPGYPFSLGSASSTRWGTAVCASRRRRRIVAAKPVRTAAAPIPI